MRISYLVLPLSLVERYRERLGFYSCTVPALEQLTLARFLSGGYFEQHLNRARLYYRERRDQVIAALEDSPLAARARISGENAGLHFLLTLDTDRTDGELKALAEARDIRLSLLSDYCARPRPEWDRTLVIPYPALDPGRMPAALAALVEIL